MQSGLIFRLAPLALLINALVFESLRFGKLTSGVLPAAALLISAGKLKTKVRIIRILRDGDLQWRHGIGGLSLLEQYLAEQRARISGKRLERERKPRSFARSVELAFGVVQKREIVE